MADKFAKLLQKTRFLFLIIDQTQKIEWEQVDEAISQVKPLIVAFTNDSFDPEPSLLLLLRKRAKIHSTLYMMNYDKDIVEIIKRGKQIFEIPLPNIRYIEIE